jgi:hypothetical protein
MTAEDFVHMSGNSRKRAERTMTADLIQRPREGFIPYLADLDPLPLSVQGTETRR